MLTLQRHQAALLVWAPLTEKVIIPGVSAQFLAECSLNWTHEAVSAFRNERGFFSFIVWYIHLVQKAARRVYNFMWMRLSGKCTSRELQQVKLYLQPLNRDEIPKTYCLIVYSISVTYVYIYIFIYTYMHFCIAYVLSITFINWSNDIILDVFLPGAM